jgi:hypothetical protein
MQLRENGLLQHWEKKYYPKLNKCADGAYKMKTKNKNHRISLKNLAGAMVALLVGITLASFSFLIEKLICLNSKKIFGLLKRN